jgi:lactoylglutathione lyase
MINKVGGIMVFVSDQGQSVKFYTEKLGFDIMVNMPYRGGKWIEVGPPKSETTLSLMVPDEKMMPSADVEYAKGLIGKSTGVWFYADDIQSSYEELKRKGVNITIPEQQDWGGIISQIRDPDGNIFALISSS